MLKNLAVVLLLTINSLHGMEWADQANSSLPQFDLGILSDVQEDEAVCHHEFYRDYKPHQLDIQDNLIPLTTDYTFNNLYMTTLNPRMPQTIQSITMHKPYLQPATPTPKNTHKPKRVIAPTADTQLANYFNTLLNARHKSIDLECCERSITSIIELKNHVRSHHMTVDAVTKLVAYRCLQSNCRKCPYHSIEGATTHLLTSLYPDIYKCPRKNCHTILSAAKSLRSHFFKNCTKPLPDLDASNQEQS
ncbi:hypothetical protein Noda2021_01340 [Candidatus Dependentiae bacterium Noda2021]|nr:hypothetical protein Noda2021_01340 [Candidatus Dependentiae bacterium Noda2021]